MQVGPVIRFHMFSVSLDRDTPSTSKNEIINIIIIFEQGEKTHKQQRARVMDTLRQYPLPIYVSNHGWLVMCKRRASDSYIINRKINGKAIVRTLYFLAKNHFFLIKCTIFIIWFLRNNVRTKGRTMIQNLSRDE